MNCLFRHSKRFDFGVPLEDCFPPNDIHPRLKYLFEEAYRTSFECGLPIDEILRRFQGSLETRLKLKESVIYDVHYHIRRDNVDATPGAYFWAIRHFLGLLPVPLLPEYAKGTTFDWSYLSERCHRYLRHYENEQKKICRLDYEIAQTLNMLPFEHFLLLSIMVIFLRKLSLKSTCRHQISRRTLLCLTKYYYSAICIRPYRPGHKEKDEKMLPLFFYITLRWRYIEQNCRKIGHPAYFLETDCLNFNKYRGVGIRDSSVQTSNFPPQVVTVYRNVPYSCNNNNYLIDTGCQTDIADMTDRSVQSIDVTTESRNKYSYADLVVDEHEEYHEKEKTEPPAVPAKDEEEEMYERTEETVVVIEAPSTKIDEEKNERFDNDVPFVTSSPLKADKGRDDLTAIESRLPVAEVEGYEPINVGFRKEKPPETRQVKRKKSRTGNGEKDFGFLNDSDSKDGWSDIVQKTSKTIKKVEEYIYDDYESFAKEDYNQISSVKSGSSLFNKISRIGWSYTPKQNQTNVCGESKGKLDETQMYYHQTYFKFEDVFDDNGTFRTNDEETLTEIVPQNKDDSFNATFQNSDLKIPLWDNPLYGKGEKETDMNTSRKSKKTFSLKRFKLNFFLKKDFLRVLTPKKLGRRSPSYESIRSNVKYKKVKNVKSTTF